MQDAIGSAQCLHTHADREGGGATKGVSSVALKATLCEYEQALLQLALPIVLKIYGAGQLLGTETPPATRARRCRAGLGAPSSRSRPLFPAGRLWQSTRGDMPEDWRRGGDRASNVAGEHPRSAPQRGSGRQQGLRASTCPRPRGTWATCATGIPST